MAVRRKKAEPPPPPPKDFLAIGKEVLKQIASVAEEKRIPQEQLLTGLEQGITQAALRHFGVEEGVHVFIDRSTGEISAKHGDKSIDPETLGRIAAQSAKQVIIQKFREAESDMVFSEFSGKKGDLLVGTATRVDAGTAILSLGKTEALLPRSEQIPGESHSVGDRIKAVVFEVRKNGNRVKIVLSRAHPDFVRTLFEEEIPEIADRTIDIRAIAHEAGYRSKLAVSSIDMKVDAVGACVGVRGSRIKTIIEELNGERIDIVRWNESHQVLIRNALQPAAIAEVFTYPRLGRALVLVEEDQLSLAIGRRGQNVRLASKLVSLDLEIMTEDELAETLDRAERWFGQLPHASEEVVQAIIGEGFLSYNDLSSIDGPTLLEFTTLTAEQADEVITYAEDYADTMEDAVQEEQRQARDQADQARREAQEQERQERQERLEAEAAANPAADGVSEPVTGDGTTTETTDPTGVEAAMTDDETRTGDDGETTPPAAADTDAGEGATA
jgi:transcription termination/antitermination protein NusA